MRHWGLEGDIWFFSSPSSLDSDQGCLWRPSTFDIKFNERVFRRQVAWRFGGNEGLERNRDWWSWTGKNAANLKQTLEQSYRELADVLLEFWCIWIKIIEKSVLEGVWGVEVTENVTKTRCCIKNWGSGSLKITPRKLKVVPRLTQERPRGSKLVPSR